MHQLSIAHISQHFPCLRSNAAIQHHLQPCGDDIKKSTDKMWFFPCRFFFFHLASKKYPVMSQHVPTAWHLTQYILLSERHTSNACNRSTLQTTMHVYKRNSNAHYAAHSVFIRSTVNLQRCLFLKSTVWPSSRLSVLYSTQFTHRAIQHSLQKFTGYRGKWRCATLETRHQRCKKPGYRHHHRQRQWQQLHLFVDWQNWRTAVTALYKLVSLAREHTQHRHNLS